MSLVRVSIALMTLTLAACASTTAPAPTPAVAASSSVARLATPAAAPAPAPMAVARPAPMVATHEDPSSQLSRERSVYFDFDEAVVRQSDIAIMERHGQYLAQHATLKVLLEGNTDERAAAVSTTWRSVNVALRQSRTPSKSWA